MFKNLLSILLVNACCVKENKTECIVSNTMMQVITSARRQEEAKRNSMFSQSRPKLVSNATTDTVRAQSDNSDLPTNRASVNHNVPVSNQTQDSVHNVHQFTDYNHANFFLYPSLQIVRRVGSTPNTHDNHMNYISTIVNDVPVLHSDINSEYQQWLRSQIAKPDSFLNMMAQTYANANNPPSYEQTMQNKSDDITTIASDNIWNLSYLDIQNSKHKGANAADQIVSCSGDDNADIAMQTQRSQTTQGNSVLAIDVSDNISANHTGQNETNSTDNLDDGNAIDPNRISQKDQMGSQGAESAQGAILINSTTNDQFLFEEYYTDDDKDISKKPLTVTQLRAQRRANKKEAALRAQAEKAQAEQADNSQTMESIQSVSITQVLEVASIANLSEPQESQTRIQAVINNKQESEQKFTNKKTVSSQSQSRTDQAKKTEVATGKIINKKTDSSQSRTDQAKKTEVATGKKGTVPTAPPNTLTNSSAANEPVSVMPVSAVVKNTKPAAKKATVQESAHTKPAVVQISTAVADTTTAPPKTRNAAKETEVVTYEPMQGRQITVAQLKELSNYWPHALLDAGKELWNKILLLTKMDNFQQEGNKELKNLYNICFNACELSIQDFINANKDLDTELYNELLATYKEKIATYKGYLTTVSDVILLDPNIASLGRNYKSMQSNIDLGIADFRQNIDEMSLSQERFKYYMTRILNTSNVKALNTTVTLADITQGQQSCISNMHNQSTDVSQSQQQRINNQFTDKQTVLAISKPSANSDAIQAPTSSPNTRNATKETEVVTYEPMQGRQITVAQLQELIKIVPQTLIDKGLAALNSIMLLSIDQIYNEEYIDTLFTEYLNEIFLQNIPQEYSDLDPELYNELADLYSEKIRLCLTCIKNHAQALLNRVRTMYGQKPKIKLDYDKTANMIELQTDMMKRMKSITFTKERFQYYMNRILITHNTVTNADITKVSIMQDEVAKPAETKYHNLDDLMNNNDRFEQIGREIVNQMLVYINNKTQDGLSLFETIQHHIINENNCLLEQYKIKLIGLKTDLRMELINSLIRKVSIFANKMIEIMRNIIQHYEQYQSDNDTLLAIYNNVKADLYNSVAEENINRDRQQLLRQAYYA